MKRNRSFYSSWFLVPALAVFFAFYFLPAMLNVLFGFTDWTTFRIDEIRFNGLANFRTMVQEPVFYKSILNTLYYTFATVIIMNVAGFLLALLLTSGLKLQSFYRTVFFLPTTLSIMVVAPVFSAIYHPQNGLLNEFLRSIGLGLLAQQWLVDERFAMNSVVAMSVWASLGLAVVLYISGLQTVPKDCLESAEIDGCGYGKKLWHIYVPLIMPSITINLVLSLINGLKVFPQVYALTNGGPNEATEVFGTLIFKNFASGLLGYSAAMGTVFTIVVMLFAVILTLYLRKREIQF